MVTIIVEILIDIAEVNQVDLLLVDHYVVWLEVVVGSPGGVQAFKAREYLSRYMICLIFQHRKIVVLHQGQFVEWHHAVGQQDPGLLGGGLGHVPEN